MIMSESLRSQLRWGSEPEFKTKLMKTGKGKEESSIPTQILM